MKTQDQIIQEAYVGMYETRSDISAMLDSNGKEILMPKINMGNSRVIPEPIVGQIRRSGNHKHTVVKVDATHVYTESPSGFNNKIQTNKFTKKQFEKVTFIKSDQSDYKKL